MKNWVEWHRSYDDPSSSLARRLAVVRQGLNQTLDTYGDTPVRVLSLCAGDGRDVLDVLTSRERPPVSAVLVELDPVLATRARENARTITRHTVEVRSGDAGDPETLADAVPVDVLLLCGIFGNVTREQVRGLIALTPTLVVPGGHTIWTRGASEPDQRNQIRTWFEDTGFAEVSFTGAPEPYGVGVNRLAEMRPAEPLASGERLFTFQ